jgi:hypothetical protein
LPGRSLRTLERLGTHNVGKMGAAENKFGGTNNIVAALIHLHCNHPNNALSLASVAAALFAPFYYGAPLTDVGIARA